MVISKLDKKDKEVVTVIGTDSWKVMPKTHIFLL